MAEKTYYIVNPQGTVHNVTHMHAKIRLAQPGWRTATKDEIKALKEADGLQTLKQRVASPWSTEPEPAPEPEASEEPAKKSSK